MRDQKNDLIRLIPGLEGCNDKDLARLAAQVDILETEPGYVLMREGTRSAEAFLVVSGEATVTIGGEMVATVGVGGWLGEIAMLRRTPRRATVTAATPMVLLAMSVPQFAEVTSDPSVRACVEEIAAHRLAAPTTAGAQR